VGANIWGERWGERETLWSKRTEGGGGGADEGGGEGRGGDGGRREGVKSSSGVRPFEATNLGGRRQNCDSGERENQATETWGVPERTDERLRRAGRMHRGGLCGDPPLSGRPLLGGALVLGGTGKKRGNELPKKSKSS